jgi:predicted dehydrogenase
MSPPDSPIRVGVVGAGFAASSHVDALRRLGHVEIAGIVASDMKRTAAASVRLGVPPAGSLDQLLESVDVVHNCTPNDVHAAVTQAAIAAGVHVLSEKPLGLTAGEATRLALSVEQPRIVTGVCFNYRHYPLVQEMRGLLAEGGDGPVHLIHGAYLQDWLLRRDDWNWRLESARAGSSRAMGDIGSHWIDLAQHVTGDVITSVTARLGTLFEERIRPPGGRQTFAQGDGEGVPVRVDTEDMATVLFMTRRGVLGAVTISQVSAGWKNHLVFEADAGESSFIWDQENPNTLRIGRRDGASREVLRDPAQLRPAAGRLAHFPAGHQEGWPDALRNLFMDFYAAIDAYRREEAYEQTFCSFAEAARVQATVEALVRSGSSRTWVDVEDIVKEVSA